MNASRAYCVNSSPSNDAHIGWLSPFTQTAGAEAASIVDLGWIARNECFCGGRAKPKRGALASYDCPPGLAGQRHCKLTADRLIIFSCFQGALSRPLIALGRRGATAGVGQLLIQRISAGSRSRRLFTDVG